MSTFEKMMSLMDDTHRSVAAQIESNGVRQGWDLSDAKVQRDGERATDTTTIMSIVGAEFDQLKARIANLEKYLEDGAAVN